MILFEYSLNLTMLFQPYTRIVPSFFVMGFSFPHIPLDSPLFLFC